MKNLGIVHPGAMGSSIAAAAASSGQRVLWCADGRSAATAARAEQYHLTDTQDLASLCAQADVIISVCPPDQAATVAAQVADCGYRGIYADCNAVAARSARQVADIVTAAGAEFVDGGIIGPPARQSGSTRLYLSGDKAQQVASLFLGSILDARVIDGGVGAASALKMAYAGWTKGSAALLLSIYAFAKQAGVNDDLITEWSLSQPGLHERLKQSAIANAVKAWRFSGEMTEIETSLRDGDLPHGFFTAAHDTYERLAVFKDSSVQSDAGSRDIAVDRVIDTLITPR